MRARAAGRIAAAWLLLGGTAGAYPQGTPAPVTVQGLGAQTALGVLNAADFGLVCDGATDNAAALGAIRARLLLSATAGQAVLFPPATKPCMTSAALVAVAGTTYRAEPGTVTLKAIASSTANPMLVSANGVSGVLFYGLTLDGNLPGVPAANNIATIYQSSGVVFDHVAVQHTRGIGLLFSTAVSNSGVRDSTFNDLGNYWLTSGANADQQQGVAFCCGAGNLSNFVTGSYFTTTGLDAVSVAAQTDFQANGNRFRAVGGRATNGGAAIYASSDDGLSVVGNTVEGAFGNGLDLHTLSHALVTGNKVRNASGGGITLATITTATVTGNLVVNSNQGGQSSFTGGFGLAGTNAGVVLAGNTSTDDQTTKTQAYGIQGLSGETCATCTFDGSNQIDGNATAAFGGTVTGYTSKVSATVAWGAQFGSGSTAGVQFLPGATGALLVGPHDGSNSGGVAPGTSAVDFQMTRSASSQVATADHSAILGGANNYAAGQFCTVLSGTWNGCNGPGSAVAGEFAQDRYRAGTLAFAAGTNVANGDSQATITPLHIVTTSTTAVRLLANTSNGGGGTANTTNCVNLPNLNFPANQEAVYGLSIRIVATDLTTPGSFLHFWEPAATLSRSTTLATTTYTPSGTATTQTIGTAGTVAIAADTTNACLAITWTAPNAHTWHVVARIDGTEAF